ncbi:nucleotidyltransferase substrate binding protein [Patescibacteria group bacterium]|nr:nucleotidyltransferase substrate binding protein [Patescibacteria group bacterium]
MAYLEERFDILEEVLKTWSEALEVEYNDLSRDAAIHRFEHTFEVLWKVMEVFLEEMEGIKCVSPKSCFRKSRNVLELSDEEIETCLKMTKDRNISTYAYSEEMAKSLYDKLEDYYKVSLKVAKQIKDRVE